MYLVHPRKNLDGKWEVAWMWLPHFLAADQDLHKLVDEKMTETFKGEVIEEPNRTIAVAKMHLKVIDLIVERYPNITGLRQLLEGYHNLSLEESPS
jgi:hypothetical protein